MRTRLLSLHQPYASFVAWLLKGNETRKPTISWRYYSGLLYLQAAQRQPKPEELARLREAMPDHPNVREFWSYFDSNPLPLGKIVCRCKMDGHLIMTPELIAKQPPLELAVGDWAEGRLAIPLDEVYAPEQPIPAVAGQGLRMISPELQQAIDAVQWSPVVRLPS